MSDFDDLAVGLARAERKPWLTRSTMVLGAAVLVLAGFLGGIEVQKANAPAASAANPGAGRGTGYGGRGFGAGAGGFGSGQFPQGGTQTAPAATTGKIKLVDGSTVYIETADGDVITVKTTGTTKVTSSTATKLASLKPGASVTVQGQTGADGTVTATSVTAGG